MHNPFTLTLSNAPEREIRNNTAGEIARLGGREVRGIVDVVWWLTWHVDDRAGDHVGRESDVDPERLRGTR